MTLSRRVRRRASHPRPVGWVTGLWPFMRPHRNRVAIAMCGAVVGQVAAAFVPVVQQTVVDDVILSDRRPLAPLIAVMLGLGVVAFVAAYVRRSLGNRFGLALQRDLSSAAFTNLQRLDLAAHDSTSGGDLLSRSTADITLVQTLLSLILDDATSAIDASTEDRVLGGLATAFSGRTTVLVAHRM